MLYTIVPILLILASLVFGYYRMRAVAPSDPLERILQFSRPFILLVAAGIVVYKLLAMQSDGSSQQRMAAPVALSAGEQIYYSEDRGPILNALYWPGSYLLYLPATVASVPNGTLALGGMLAFIFAFAPIWFVLRPKLNKTGIVESADGRSVTWMLMAAAWYVSLLNEPLRNSNTTVHCDAPALGFTCLAGWFGFQAARSVSWGPTLLCAGSMAAAAVCKQTALGLYLSVPLFVIFSAGWRRAALLLAVATLFFIIAAAVFCAWFGFERIYWNTIVLPSKHPFIAMSDIHFPLTTVEEVASHLLWPVALVTSGLFLLKYNKAATATPAAMYLTIAIMNIPAAVFGRIKVGGYQNTLSVTIFPAMVALLSLAKLYMDSGGTAARAAKSFILSICCIGALSEAPYLFNYKEALRYYEHGNSQTAFEYSKKHPGKAWFPWYPIAGMLAEGKMYHYAYGLFDHYLAGYKLSQQHLQAHIPTNPEWIAFSPDDLQFVMEYFPEYTVRGSEPELPGWTVFKKKN